MYLNQKECFMALSQGWVLQEKNKCNTVYLDNDRVQQLSNKNRNGEKGRYKPYSFDRANTWKKVHKLSILEKIKIYLGFGYVYKPTKQKGK